MTRVLVTGGTGILGRQVVKQLELKRYTPRIMSRRTGKQAGAEWVQADLSIAHTLNKAVDGVDVIVHAASGAKLRKVDIEGTQKLIAAAHNARVKHILYVSIVGIDRIPFFYYQAKLQAEHLIEAGSVPWSILRATQFHSLPNTLFKNLSRFPLFFVPKTFKVQPIDPLDVAERIVNQVSNGAGGRLADIGGPEVLTLGDMAQSWLKAQGKQRRILHLPLRGQVARGFREGFDTVPNNPYGKLTWQHWLEQKYSS